MMLRFAVARSCAVVWFWNIYQQVRKTMLKIQGFLCIMAEFALSRTYRWPSIPLRAPLFRYLFPSLHPHSLFVHTRSCPAPLPAHFNPCSPPHLSVLPFMSRIFLFAFFRPSRTSPLPSGFPLLYHPRPSFPYFPIRCRFSLPFRFSHSVQQLPACQNACLIARSRHSPRLWSARSAAWRAASMFLTRSTFSWRWRNRCACRRTVDKDPGVQDLFISMAILGT